MDQKFDDDPSGKLMKDIISAFAAFEKNMINIRTSEQKKTEARRKDFFTGGKIPFGYKLVNSDFLQIDEKTAYIVKCIFMLERKKILLQKNIKIYRKCFLHFSAFYNNKIYFIK